ncbi:Alpha/Beta hydrolase protein [Zychaea mexicana]|uniref:Alpha/Beta hydrolase protein n=1 Tax=Zychaea mexicana TaxID=64656 RepID=UPI0022FDCE38|nr:Alpha/Beta hydrolase protein [Zychaea mexicana]KAI9495239.1 Alpha/Beta hydrolase protein [Zychaea mexicana]
MTRLTPTYEGVISVHPITTNHDTMRLAVERHEFPPPSGSSATARIAFLWSHGSGFHKELLHPLMRRFIERLRSKSVYESTHIDFIAWDNRTHGDSARLNHEYLDQYKVLWFDLAMDTLQVIRKMALGKEGYDKLIGVAHSIGASTMLLAEFIQPNIFDGICIMEPVIRNWALGPAEVGRYPLITSTLKRQDTWPDREACRKTLRKNPVWRKLHPEALENYVNYGLYDTDEGKVKLKCPKKQESLLSQGATYDAYTSCMSLKMVSIPVHAVLCKQPMIDVTARSHPEDIGAQSAMVTVCVIDGWHTLPAEDPDRLVPEIERLTEVVLCNKENDKKNFRESRL